VRVLPAFLVLALLLSGCSDPPPGADDGTPQTDFQDLDLVATSTTGVIRGIVVDEAIRPVANASVTLTPGDKTAATTGAGTFGFDDLEPGTYFLKVARSGYNATQVSTEVVAGLAEPPIVKVLLVANPQATPYVEVYSFTAFMTCGFSVIASSVGCDTFEQTAEALGDEVYFPLQFTSLPEWIQGELVWQHTQAAGGMAIWQLAGCADTETDAAGSHYCDAPTSQESPALTSVGPDLILENEGSMLSDGVQFNLFGGPMPECNVAFYGCGVTVNQRYEVYAHVFYNWVPAEGWRFTADGEPVLPQ
jgi:hypothetical protein